MVQTPLQQRSTSTGGTSMEAPHDDPQDRLMAPDDSTEVVLARLDGRLGVVESKIEDLRLEVRGGFANLSHVRTDVYDANRTTDREQAAETRRIAEQARTVAMATLTFVIVAIGAMLALIKAVGG